MYIFLYLAMTLCAGFAFGYGVARFFRTRKALYTRMIVFGLGCAMMGRLFETISLFAFGEIPSGFHIGILGIIGSFLFFFTANYGQMDSLVDDGSRRYLKVRLIALAAPVVIVALYCVFLKYADLEDAIVGAVEALVISMASYYNLKHLIIRDVDYGVIDSIRYYNFLALIYAIICMIQMIFTAAPVPGALVVTVDVIYCVLMLIFVPVLERGVSKWVI